jgi:hypothetical protein
MRAMVGRRTLIHWCGYIVIAAFAFCAISFFPYHKLLPGERDLSPRQDHAALLRWAAGHNDVDEALAQIADGAKIDTYDGLPLRWSAFMGNTEIAMALLQAGADSHVLADQPLRLAAMNGHTEVVRLLLSAGAHVHAMEDQALRLAALNHHTEVMHLLLDAGADVRALDKPAPGGIVDAQLLDFLEMAGAGKALPALRPRQNPQDITANPVRRFGILIAPPGCAALKDPASYKGHSGYKYLESGYDGWIFRTRADFKEDFDINRQTRNAIVRMLRLLDKKQIHLAIVLQPTRGMLAGDYIMSAGYRREEALRSYRRTIEKLRSYGVTTADLTRGPQGAAFFSRRDTHWTREGADYAARTIAALLEPYLGDVPRKEFVREKGTERGFKGVLAKAFEGICKMSIPEEHFTSVSTYTTQGGLFDDERPQVVLVGTSNSAISRADFAGALKKHLNADVLNVAVSGGGIDTSLLDYLSSPGFRDAPPRIIVWEIPAYDKLRSESLYAQIIPALQGPCTAPLQAEDVIVSGQYDLGRIGPVNGGRGYLHITAQGNLPRSLKYYALYNGEREWTASLVSERAKRREFFVEFDARRNRHPTGIVLETPPQERAELHVEVCTY